MFAHIVGCSLPTARAHLRDGCPSRGREGRALKIPLGAAVRWVIERVTTRHQQALAEARARTQPALNVERTKLARVQRQLATLRMRELRGELVKASDAERVLRAIVVATKTQLLAVPRRAVLAGLPRDREGFLKQLLVDALRELAAVKTFRELDAVGRITEES